SLLFLVGLGIILFLNFFPFVSPNIFNASIVSSQKNYLIGDRLNLTIFLNFSNVPSNSFLETNEGHNISLRELLKFNGKSFSCETFDCARIFTKNLQLSYPHTIRLEENKEELIGFEIRENSFSRLDDFKLNLSTSFQESNSTPLQIFVAGRNVWNFSEHTNNFVRFLSYGCFDLSSSISFDKKISDRRYCEKITNVPQTKKFLLGANFSNPNNLNSLLRLSLLDRRREEVGSCTFMSLNSNSCNITFERELNSGEYYVCISSNSVVDIYLGYQPRKNSSCGYFDSSFTNPVGDYYLFLRVPSYSPFNGQIFLKEDQNNFEVVNVINNYINKFYKRNCSFGCIIPISFLGSNQNLTVLQRNTGISYSSSSGITSNQEIFNLSLRFPLESFSGNLNLFPSNFTLRREGNNINLSFYLSNDYGRVFLFSERINVSSRPIIKDLYPKIFPVGINVTIYADYLLRDNITSFKWFFVKENITKFTNISKVNHSFSEVGEQTIVLTLTNNKGVSSTVNFTVVVFASKNITLQILSSKNASLTKLIFELKNNFSSIFNDLDSSLSLSFLKNQLQDLSAKLSLAENHSEILNITNMIYKINIPSKIKVEIKEDVLFVKDIPSDLIRLVIEKNYSGDTRYKDYVYNWNIRQDIETNKKSITKIDLLDEKNVFFDSIIISTFYLKPNEDSIFFIEAENITSSSHQFSSFGNFKVLNLKKNNDYEIKIITKGNKEPSFYVIPLSLKNFSFVEKIDACNFNSICEKKLGEDYKNCRNDCKPWHISIPLLILIFLVFLVIYTIIQINLKKGYEKKLFKSERDLLNVISFFKSYEEKGLSRQEAIQKLIKAGWSKEQAEYAAKKAKGERTRPYEIIPVEKIKILFQKK
ncbi:MAG: PKD domain-containing protein, partial [Candidatus Pacearchaeota archaeon]